MKYKFSLVIIFIIVIFTNTAHAQRCPLSKRTIKVFVQNEHRANDVEYRLIPLKGKVSSEELVSTQFLWNKFEVRDPDHSIIILQYDGSIELNSYYAEKFVRYLKPEKEPKDLQGNKLSGNITNGELLFNASDMNSDFYLLAVSSSNYQTAYLLGRILGGCNNTDTVILRWLKRSPTIKKQ